MDFYDAFCANTLIKAYSCSLMPQKALFFYFEMLKDGFFPNSFSFPPLISACVKMGSVKMGQICHAHVVKNGVDSVLQVQNALVHFYACFGLMDVAREVFDEMSVRDMVTFNTLINGFVKAGEISVAHKLFDAMVEKNVVLWNIMITGYLKLGNPGNGLKLFRKMMEVGCRGNDVTIVNAITACSRSARLKEGKSVHGWLIRKRVKLTLFINTALIYMYSRCQRVDIAQLIFDELSIRNLVCWNAMILGNCIHGNALDGLSLFTEMIDDKRGKKRVLPDEITFIGVLCACAREGLLIQGRKLFSLMKDEFNIKPSFAHHWCMANLYAKVGLLQDAVEVLRDIELDEDALPESSLFAGLFTSVRFQGSTYVGEKIAKELIEQDPLNFSYYELLVNVYAASERWEEVTQTKDLMKSRGILKIPGCGLKNLEEVVHNTRVEEEWRSREDVLALLQ
ncbi:hypothetical protein LIER_30400 [Lithospermum erythrorhizon]|uniref:Pentatricopeptide repeat-containing protein n=1 Tax=Lithospermum erythrorhizon TaxID=34254 RepID=A0AAV3RR39_LITER